MKIFDGAYKTPPKGLIDTQIKNTEDNYIYYYSLFFNNITYDKNIGNFSVYNGIMLEYDNSAIYEEKINFGEYSPELFYKINKLLIKKIREDYEQSNRFIFIKNYNYNYIII